MRQHIKANKATVRANSATKLQWQLDVKALAAHEPATGSWLVHC